MKTYLSVLDAWDEVKRLNSAAGRRAYTVTGSMDGFAVRRLPVSKHFMFENTIRFSDSEASLSDGALTFICDTGEDLVLDPEETKRLKQFLVERLP